MERRIDPPSSIYKASLDSLRIQARSQDLIIALENGKLLGCVFGLAKAESYYIGKLAVLNAYGRDRLLRKLKSENSPHTAQFYRESLQLLPDAAIIQIEKIIVDANHAAARLIGLEQDKIIGQDVKHFVSTDKSSNYTLDKMPKISRFAITTNYGSPTTTG